MILLFFFCLPLTITLCVLVSELLAAWKTLHSQKKSSSRNARPTRHHWMKHITTKTKELTEL